MILHEVYFGKSKGLIEAEEALDKYRAKYMNSYRNPKCLSDPELDRYCSIMEDEFGFGCFSMDIDLVESTNAGTIPISKAIDIAPQFRLKKNLIADESGFKYNKKADYYYYMIMNAGLIFNPELTTEEVQAIIMHEVGHNFYTVTTSWGLYTSDVFYFLNVITAIIQNIVVGRVDAALKNAFSVIATANVSRKITVSLSKLIEKSPALSAVFGLGAALSGLFSDLSINAGVIINWIFGIQMIPIGIISNIMRYISNPTGYADEKFADNFATMYGYGPALVSGFEKMQAMGFNVTINKAISSNPILKSINYFYAAPISVLSGMFDEHPQFIERARDQQRYLERELSKSNIDPRMKKKLLDNSKALNRQIDDYVKYKSKLSPKQYEDFKRDYQVMMDTMFNGDFRHNFDIPSADLAKQVDRTYANTKLV